MKLLFDQNLSFKLSQRLDDLFPQSSQVRPLGLDQSDDKTIWEYARTNGLVIVTQDADFADLSALHGHPPKVIWLRCGNQRTAFIEALLFAHAARITEFEGDPVASCLEIY